MLSVGQDFVGHHAKASVLAGSTLPRLQHVEIHLFLGVVDFLADTLAAGFVALRAPPAVGLTIETHKTVSFPFHFEQARFVLVVGGLLRRVVVRKPLVLDGGKLGPLVGLDQLFQRVARQRHVGRIGIHFQVLKVSPIQKGVDAMVIEFQHA